MVIAPLPWTTEKSYVKCLFQFVVSNLHLHLPSQLHGKCPKCIQSWCCFRADVDSKGWKQAKNAFCWETCETYVLHMFPIWKQYWLYLRIGNSEAFLLQQHQHSKDLNIHRLNFTMKSKHLTIETPVCMDVTVYSCLLSTWYMSKLQMTLSRASTIPLGTPNHTFRNSKWLIHIRTLNHTSRMNT